MKMIRLVSCLVAALVALSVSGCSTMSKANPFAKKSTTPPAPPPVSVASTGSGSAPAVPTPAPQVVQQSPQTHPIGVHPAMAGQQASQTVTQMQGSGNQYQRPVVGGSRQRPRLIQVSVFDNVINARPGRYPSSASVVVTNKRVNERLALQISDWLVGVPDVDGSIGVMILPPGESFALYDLGLGPKTILKAVVLDDNGNRLGYLAVEVKWPQGFNEAGGETSWDVSSPLAGSPDPMILLPPSSSMTATAPILTPITAGAIRP